MFVFEGGPFAKLFFDIFEVLEVFYQEGIDIESLMRTDGNRMEPSLVSTAGGIRDSSQTYKWCGIIS